MNTVLLALGNDVLKEPCRHFLEHRGYCVVPVDRPLAALNLDAAIQWDAALLDASSLGRDALEALTLAKPRPLIGLGLEDRRLSVSLRLPLVAETLIAALARLLFVESQQATAGLVLNPLRRSVSIAGREMSLTRTEYRLLKLLQDRSPATVALGEVLIAVWGTAEGEGTSELVRAHLRNLRRKLLQIGLTDAIQSRRGRGYSLEI